MRTGWPLAANAVVDGAGRALVVASPHDAHCIHTASTMQASEAHVSTSAPCALSESRELERNLRLGRVRPATAARTPQRLQPYPSGTERASAIASNCRSQPCKEKIAVLDFAFSATTKQLVKRCAAYRLSTHDSRRRQPRPRDAALNDSGGPASGCVDYTQGRRREPWFHFQLTLLARAILVIWP